MAARNRNEENKQFHDRILGLIQRTRAGDKLSRAEMQILDLYGGLTKTTEQHEHQKRDKATNATTQKQKVEEEQKRKRKREEATEKAKATRAKKRAKKEKKEKKKKEKEPEPEAEAEAEAETEEKEKDAEPEAEAEEQEQEQEQDSEMEVEAEAPESGKEATINFGESDEEEGEGDEEGTDTEEAPAKPPAAASAPAQPLPALPQLPVALAPAPAQAIQQPPALPQAQPLPQPVQQPKLVPMKPIIPGLAPPALPDKIDIFEAQHTTSVIRRRQLADKAHEASFPIGSWQQGCAALEQLINQGTTVSDFMVDWLIHQAHSGASDEVRARAAVLLENVVKGRHYAKDVVRADRFFMRNEKFADAIGMYFEQMKAKNLDMAGKAAQVVQVFSMLEQQALEDRLFEGLGSEAEQKEAFWILCLGGQDALLRFKCDFDMLLATIMEPSKEVLKALSNPKNKASNLVLSKLTGLIRTCNLKQMNVDAKQLPSSTIALLHKLKNWYAARIEQENMTSAKQDELELAQAQAAPLPHTHSHSHSHMAAPAESKMDTSSDDTRSAPVSVSSSVSEGTSLSMHQLEQGQAQGQVHTTAAPLQLSASAESSLAVSQEQPAQQQQGQAPADSHASMAVDTPVSVSMPSTPALVPVIAPADVQGDRALAMEEGEEDPRNGPEDACPFTESAASSSSAGVIVSESQAETQPGSQTQAESQPLPMPAGSEL